VDKKTLDRKTLDQSASRKPRADALRNRDRLLKAARAIFRAGGPEASLEAVARTAGVGIGTLYRHFPTREVLFEAVYRHEVQQLADLAERLKKEDAIQLEDGANDPTDCRSIRSRPSSIGRPPSQWSVFLTLM
jgi:AcrR family transcriptional regulator